MGIEADRFVFAVPQDSYCFLCSLVLEDPVEIVECGHYFCSKCIEKWKENNSYEEHSTCPYCGIDVGLNCGARKSKLIWNLIQNMNVNCIHKNCEVTYKYGFDDLHKQKCLYENLKNKENNNESELKIEKCPTCRISLGNDINSHECMKELGLKIKEQASLITNLEHENNRLMFKLSTCEKQYLEERTEIDGQFYMESLRCNKEIRDLRTRLAHIQGELAVKKGKSDLEELSIDIERVAGSLGFNIIGGASKNGESTGGIFVSRIVEQGAADQPGKLLLHDQILEVDGVDLRNATHELAVETFRASGDPVKMVVQRQVRKTHAADIATQTKDSFGVMFSVTTTDEDVFVANHKNSTTVKDYNNSNNKLHHKNSKNNGRWFSPHDISASTDMSSTNDIVEKLNAHNNNNNNNKDSEDKEEYDSAYDTLLTNKSSRCSHQSSVADQSDIESTNTERTLAADSSSVDGGLTLRHSARDNSSDSEKRRSTFFIIPDSADNKTKVLDDLNSSTGEPEADFDFEYEEIILKKTSGKFGVLLCYGGAETDASVFVGDVEENSTADISGKIMVGDQIVQINNCHVTNVEQAYRMFEANDEITLIVARAGYDAPSEYYDEAEETDLDMLDCIAEESESQFASKTSSPTYASSVSSKSSDKSPTHRNKGEELPTSIARTRSRTLSPVEIGYPDFEVSPRERSSSNDFQEDKRQRIPSTDSVKFEKEPKKNSLKNFVKNKLGGQKDKRTGSHSDDSCDFSKLPRCDSNSSTNSNKSQKSKESASVSKAKSNSSNELLKNKIKDQRQQSKMKAYMDSPSLNNNRHRVNTNVSLFQAPYMINNANTMPFTYQGVSNMVPVYPSRPPQLTPTPQMNGLGNRNSMTASVSSLRSALKNSQMNRPEQRVAKRVQIDPHPGWNDTEKRVWEEFKIIQSMEKENSENNKINGGDLGGNTSNVEAEWRVRRSKDGKHVYIKKTNSSRNKILKDRAQQINDERCGMTTDDDAFTVYQGQYWNRDQRKRQLLRHNERRKKIVQKAEIRANYENKTEKEMAELVQRNMTLPVFDNFITIEEILSQRNRSGIFTGPIHVTTI